MIEESKAFCKKIKEENLLADISYWFQEMDKSKFFEQSQGLKKAVLSEVCTIVFQPIKDIVNK